MQLSVAPYEYALEGEAGEVVADLAHLGWAVRAVPLIATVAHAKYGQPCEVDVEVIAELPGIDPARTGQGGARFPPVPTRGRRSGAGPIPADQRPTLPQSRVDERIRRSAAPSAGRPAARPPASPARAPPRPWRQVPSGTRPPPRADQPPGDAAGQITRRARRPASPGRTPPGGPPERRVSTGLVSPLKTRRPPPQPPHQHPSHAAR
jgi:hypothetical protein